MPALIRRLLGRPTGPCMLPIGTAAGPWFLEAAVVEAGGEVSLRTRVLREPAGPVTAPRLEINGAARECVAMYRYSRKAGAHEILDGTCYEYDAAGVRIDSIAVVAGGETGYRRRGLRLDPGRLGRVTERAREEAAPAGAALMDLVLRLPGPVLDLGGRRLADMLSRGGAAVGCRAEESRALYPDRSFESVICHGLLDSASDPDEVANEAARLCRSEALFTVADSSTRPAGSFNQVNLAALSGSARQADKILRAVQEDPRFLARRFDYDLKFVRHWIEATRAGVRFDAT